MDKNSLVVGPGWGWGPKAPIWAPVACPLLRRLLVSCLVVSSWLAREYIQRDLKRDKKYSGKLSQLAVGSGGLAQYLPIWEADVS